MYFHQSDNWPHFTWDNAKITEKPPLDAPHPGILNAIFAATGARVTRIPATPDKVLAALKALYNLSLIRRFVVIILCF